MPESRKRQKEAPATPRFPSEQRRCRYCKLMFKTKPTYNGSKMKFCSERHRKAFDKEGGRSHEKNSPAYCSRMTGSASISCSIRPCRMMGNIGPRPRTK